MAHRARLIAAGCVALGIAIVAVPTWTGVVTVEGAHVPLPTPAIRVGERSWIVPGRRDVAGFLREAAPPYGWTVGEQLGALHTLDRHCESAHLTQQIVASVFTRIDVQLRKTAPDAAPPGG